MGGAHGTVAGRRNRFCEMTKLEICACEDTNPGQVYLYPEGAFYKAYQKSAWLSAVIFGEVFRRIGHWGWGGV